MKRPPEGTSLSHDRIVDRAVAVADQEGINAVSMRRLARDLAVTPMALYWHFEGKDALLDAMAEHVVRDARFTDRPRAGWETRYRNVLTTLVGLLQAHPWMGRLVVERLVPLPSYLRALEILLDCARLAGASPHRSTVLAQQSVQTVVTLVEYEPKPVTAKKANAERAALEAALDDLAPLQFPGVHAAAGLLTTPPDLEDYYRVGIDTIIRGVGAVAAAAGSTASRPRSRGTRAARP